MISSFRNAIVSVMINNYVRMSDYNKHKLIYYFERNRLLEPISENESFNKFPLATKFVVDSLKRTLSPYFRNLPLLHITIRLHLTSRLLKFMQWLARKQYVLVVGKAI